jgi:hypothetical protein
VNGDDDLSLVGRVVVAVSLLLGLLAAALGIDRRYVTRAEANQIQQACKDEWERIRLEIAHGREERSELSARIREMDDKIRDRNDNYHRENQRRLDQLYLALDVLGKDLARLSGKLTKREEQA